MTPDYFRRPSQIGIFGNAISLNDLLEQRPSRQNVIV
jgi:hypothetical protein